MTLSLCGLGMLDETEIETIPNARPIAIAETGEIEPENISQETGEITKPVEIIDTMSDWAVTQAASAWNIGKPEAAKELGKKKLGKMDKAEFIAFLNE